MAEKIIVFDAHEPSLVCALSYFLEQGYKLEGSPLEEIAILWDNPDAWLFNINIMDSNQETDFYLFEILHPHKHISLQNLIDLGEDKNLNPEANALLRDWKQQRSLMALAREIREKKTYSDYAIRYMMALTVSRTTKGEKENAEIFIAAARELAYKKKNFEITNLANQYPTVAKATENAIQKIKIQPSAFDIPNRQVAYGYLDNVSPMVDLYAIKKEITNKFPYLAVIQYRKNSEEFTCIVSKELDLQKIFLLDKNEALTKGELTYEALIKGELTKVNKRFREIISEIT
ncbi:MAG: hypothetical protein PHG95_04235 [Patescibacteria group bacterium]|nr:hypothetical protein [Patescibacteria group bacterium]